MAALTPASAWFEILIAGMVSAALKGVVWLGIAACIVLVLRGASASVRHYVWLLAMAGLVALPGLCIALPRWHVLPNWPPAAFDSRAAEPPIAQAPVDGDTLPVLDAEGVAQEAPVLASASGGRWADAQGADGATETRRGTDAATQEPRGPGLSWAWRLAGGVWLAGLGLLAAVQALALWRLHAARQSASVATGRLQGIAAEALVEMGLAGRVRVLLARGRSMPLTWGFASPRILLPAEAVDWPDEQVLAVVLHEAAHIVRHDYAALSVTRLACAVHWFNPLVWIAARQMAAEREAACDDRVLAAGVRPSDYARNLLHVARSYCGRPGLPSAGMGMARSSKLERRIRGILNPEQNRRPLSRVARVAGLGVLCLALAPLGVAATGAGIEDDPTNAGTRGAKAGNAAASAEDDPPQDARAAELVQKVYDSFAWVDKAKSFRIKTSYRVTHTEQKRKHEAAHPDKTPFGSNGYINPRAFCSETEWAWTADRLRYHRDGYYEEGNEPRTIDLRVWDGALAVECFEIEGQGHQQYVFSDNPQQEFGMLVENMASLPWGPGGPHDLWWNPVDIAEQRASRGRTSKDFEYEGRAMLDGRLCHKVVSKVGHYRYHIGVDDGRLYRVTWLYVFNKNPAYNYLALCQSIGGAAIKTKYHWTAWLEELEPDQRMAAFRKLQRAEFPFLRPIYHLDLSDYREVATGRWMPFKQRRESYEFEAAKPFLSAVSTQEVTAVHVDEPLDPSLFVFEPIDGVRVSTDWRYEPHISYTYHKDQTEEERQALCEEKKREQEKTAAMMRDLKAVLESRMGSTPPPLPKSGWLNSDGVNWEQLKGKVVVLHFWEVNCGPCQNELPFLESWHKNGGDSIAVIGVHPPTDDVAAVTKKMKEFGIKYPVVVEYSDAEGNGPLHEWFGNKWWPNTVLIDKHGVVADHGRLWLGDVGDKMRRMVTDD